MSEYARYRKRGESSEEILNDVSVSGGLNEVGTNIQGDGDVGEIEAGSRIVKHRWDLAYLSRVSD